MQSRSGRGRGGHHGSASRSTPDPSLLSGRSTPDVDENGIPRLYYAPPDWRGDPNDSPSDIPSDPRFLSYRHGVPHDSANRTIDPRLLTVPADPNRSATSPSVSVRGSPNISVRGSPNIAVRSSPNVSVRGSPSISVRGTAGPNVSTSRTVYPNVLNTPSPRSVQADSPLRHSVSSRPTTSGIDRGAPQGSSDSSTAPPSTSDKDLIKLISTNGARDTPEIPRTYLIQASSYIEILLKPYPIKQNGCTEVIYGPADNPSQAVITLFVSWLRNHHGLGPASVRAVMPGDVADAAIDDGRSGHFTRRQTLLEVWLFGLKYLNRLPRFQNAIMIELLRTRRAGMTFTREEVVRTWAWYENHKSVAVGAGLLLMRMILHQMTYDREHANLLQQLPSERFMKEYLEKIDMRLGDMDKNFDPSHPDNFTKYMRELPREVPESRR